MFDYVIVGAGSAGCVLANRLSENPAVKVALLEAGGADQSVFVQCPAGLAVLAQTKLHNWAYQTVPQQGLNGRRGYQPRGKVLGGSSSINAMIYIRGQHADYDHWASLGNTGWAWNDVLPYFKKSEDNPRGADKWHGTGGMLHAQDLTSPNVFGQHFIDAAMQAGYKYNHDFNGETQEGVGHYQVTHKNGERHSTAKGYLAQALARPNLKVITHAQVKRICFDGKRASGVEYVQGGQTHTVSAQAEVLLCAGAFGSPQILQLSGVGASAQLQALGIGLVHDLPGVGENLHDHVDAVQVYHAPGQTDLFGLSVTGALNTLRGIAQWHSQRTGMLTTNFAESGGFVKSSPEVQHPDFQFHFVVGKLIDHGRKLALGHGYSCHLCLLRPKSRGTLKLATARFDDAPLIDPGFLTHADDMPLMIEGFKAMRHVMNQPALKRFGGYELELSAHAKTDAQIEQFLRNNSDTVYHPVGSCKMGSDALAVVNAELKVHGLQGLRVVDASIMPSIVSGNTNAPVVMIAEKAADMIKAGA